MDLDSTEDNGEYACTACGGVFRTEQGRYVTLNGNYCPDCYATGSANFSSRNFGDGNQEVVAGG